MRTRQWIGLGVMVACGLIAGLASPAAQAENGRPSRQAMEAMGLGSLVVMSDDEAMTVRGQGYRGGGSHVAVSGNSFATVTGPNGGAHSENAYAAEGKHKAGGSNSSYAGVADIWIGGKGNGGHAPRNNSYGSKKPNGGGGGYGGGGHGGRPSIKIHATVFFSGGHSSAWAF